MTSINSSALATTICPVLSTIPIKRICGSGAIPVVGVRARGRTTSINASGSPIGTTPGIRVHTDCTSISIVGIGTTRTMTPIKDA